MALSDKAPASGAASDRPRVARRSIFEVSYAQVANDAFPPGIPPGSSPQGQLGLHEPESERFTSSALNLDVPASVGDRVVRRSAPRKARQKSMAAPTREEIDAKMGEMTARLEATEARIAASLTRIESSLAEKPGSRTLFVAVGSAAATIVTIILAVLAIAGDRFDGGMQAASVSVDQAYQAKASAEAAMKQLEEVRKQNQLILDLLSRNPTPSSSSPGAPATP